MRQISGPADAVVFLHGLFGHSGDFDTVAALLRRRIRTFAPELPIATGFGKLETVPELVVWLERTLETARVRRPILVGNSLGGHVALSFALAHPERAAALVLTGSSGLFERGIEAGVPRRPDRDWVRRKISDVFHDPDLASDLLVEEAHKLLSDRSRYASVLRLARNAKQESLAPSLHRISVPTLLLWGESDRITPPDVARSFASHISGARLLFIPACGHAPTLERPSLFAFHLSAFLNDVCPAARVDEEAA